MNRFVMALAVSSTLALAACGNAPEQPAAETPAAAAPAETPATAAPAAPAETTPATPEVAPPAAPEAAVQVDGNTPVPGTDMTVDEAMQAIQAQTANMTDEQKAQAVTEARSQAEAMAKSSGLTDEQVRQAGDAAEAAAKQMFGIQ